MPCANSPRSALPTSSIAAGIENRESRFYNRFGQLIYQEPRGKFAGYQYPEIGIHRGKLHMILYKAARERLGEDAILTDHEALSVEQDERAATVHFKARAQRARRRGDRLRGHQFGPAQAVLSGRQGRLRRHQYLARRHPAQSRSSTGALTCASARSSPASW